MTKHRHHISYYNAHRGKRDYVEVVCNQAQLSPSGMWALVEELELTDWCFCQDLVDTVTMEEVKHE